LGSSGIAAPDMGMSEAEKKRAQRERARAAGKCIVCRKRKARKGRVTCGPCNEDAKERMRLRRQR